MPNKITTIIAASWPPARRREQEAEAARQRAEAEAKRQARQAEKERQKAKDQRLEAYNAHVAAVDLNGVGTRRGEPLPLAEVSAEVARRFDLADAVGRPSRIQGQKEDSRPELVEAMKGLLDADAVRVLLDHDDPERQRTAAEAIMDARVKTDLDPWEHATAAAEVAAHSRRQPASRNGTSALVEARAVLLRSTDPRWSRRLKGEPRPLSARPFSAR